MDFNLLGQGHFGLGASRPNFGGHQHDQGQTFQKGEGKTIALLKIARGFPMGGKLDETLFMNKKLISHFIKKPLKRSCKKKTSKERNVWRQTQMSKCAQMCI